MFGSRQTSPRRDAEASRPDGDSDSASVTRSESRRKRPRPADDRQDRDDPPCPACDQCRLRKVRCDRRQPDCSNCRKAGIECNSSTTLKRVNHMKQLRDDFSDVIKQLGDVDHTLGILTDLARQITSRPSSRALHPQSPGHPGITSHDALPLSASELLDLVQPKSQDDCCPSPSPLTAKKPLCETIELDQGGECLYSYPSPLVLIKSLFHQATSLLDSDQEVKSHESGESHVARGLQHPAVRATLQQKLGDFPPDLRSREPVVASNMNPVTTPPRLMVNLFVQGYLRHINMRTPIFDEAELYRAIDDHYSDQQVQESRAWALIMNNIVLLELGLEIQTARASHSTSRATNDDILPSFLRNCDRAIGNLEAFMAPNLVNLQALMTLTLATREFYTNATAERVCHAACQVGRVMGIHRSRDHRQGKKADITAASERKRGQLFRILYAMDKQRVFMTGHPCDVHMFDSDHQIGHNSSHKNDDHPISDAFDHLMTIWEEIYLNLYTLRAASGGTETRSRQIRRVTSSLDKFAQVHAGLLSPSLVDATEDIDLLRIELLYGYQVSQILVLQSDQGNEQSLDKMRDLARSSLWLILEVCKPPLTTARLALLARMFRGYPMVAFVELVAFRLESLATKEELDSTTLADISLLRAICEQLGTLQYDNLTHVFYARLSSGLVWALETLEALADVLTIPSPQPQSVAAFSQQMEHTHQPTESLHNPRNASGSIASDISDASTLYQNRGSQGGYSKLKSPIRLDEQDFCQARSAEMTNFGLFTPETDCVDPFSRPLSPLIQTGALPFSTTQQSHLEMASGPLPPPNTVWGDFNLDFF